MSNETRVVSLDALAEMIVEIDGLHEDVLRGKNDFLMLREIIIARDAVLAAQRLEIARLRAALSWIASTCDTESDIADLEVRRMSLAQATAALESETDLHV